MSQKKEAVAAHFDGYSSSWHNRIKLYPYFSRFRAVKQMLRDEKNHRVLDIGSGAGDYAALFDLRSTDYLGMDISEGMVGEASRLYPGYSFKVGDGEATGLASDYYDTVLSIAVVEYLDIPDRHLAEISRLTINGGTAIICVQNADNTTKTRDRSLLEHLKFILKIKQLFFRSNPTNTNKDPMVTHRKFSLDELSSLGKQYGLILEDYRYVCLQFIPVFIDQYLNINPKLSTYFEKNDVQKKYLNIAKKYATILVCKLRKK